MMQGEDVVISAAVIRWNFPPPWTLASKVRELMLGIYEELLDPNEIQCVAMAAYELLENLLKYAGEGASVFDVEISNRAGGGHVRIRTTNIATSDRIDAVQRLVERIRGAADPISIYDELILAGAGPESSGLGLARIRAEGEMEVGCVANGVQVTVMAERRVKIRTVA